MDALQRIDGCGWGLSFRHRVDLLIEYHRREGHIPDGVEITYEMAAAGALSLTPSLTHERESWIKAIPTAVDRAIQAYLVMSQACRKGGAC